MRPTHNGPADGPLDRTGSGTCAHIAIASLAAIYAASFAFGDWVAASEVGIVGGASGPAVVNRLNTVADPNKLPHIFDDPTHNLGGVVAHFGSQEAAYAALDAATQAAVKAPGSTGLYLVVVDPRGTAVTVTGMVIDGVARIGTAILP